jgi:hypothetical protein
MFRPPYTLAHHFGTPKYAIVIHVLPIVTTDMLIGRLLHYIRVGYLFSVRLWFRAGWNE